MDSRGAFTEDIVSCLVVNRIVGVLSRLVLIFKFFEGA